MNLLEKRPNKWWTEPDTFTMLALIEQLDLVSELDKKRQRNESHFRRLRQSLAKRDIHFTVNQIRNRWKSLKHKYRKIKLATYRSPAARLSAIESFRYFRKLDRMLACRPRSGSPVGGHRGDHILAGQSDVEDHAKTPWSASLESETESIAPMLESSPDEGANAEELTSTERQSWAAGSHEVMTLGLSGEYLCAVKTEPHSDIIPFPAIDESEEASETGFPGTSADICSLILKQLTILNHQLEEQLAEQRAFHCSMLGMMDRQIEVLQQLSSFTHNSCSQPKPEPSENESAISQKVHETLLKILSRMENQAPQPCLSRTPHSAPPVPPPWTVSLVEVHKRSCTVDGGPGSEAENTKCIDGCKQNSSNLNASDLLSSSPRNSALPNGLAC